MTNNQVQSIANSVKRVYNLTYIVNLSTEYHNDKTPLVLGLSVSKFKFRSFTGSSYQTTKLVDARVGK